MMMMMMMKHQEVYAESDIRNDVVVAFDFADYRQLDEEQPPPQQGDVEITIQEDDDVTIQEVSLSVKIVLGVMSVLVGTAALLAIIVMIHHRKHSIMTLSQSPFLIALSACLLISSIFTFTDLPTRDIYCSVNDLLVDLPLTVAATIILARVWRVHVTLSNANMFARRRTMQGDDYASNNNNNKEDRFSVGVVIVAVLTFLAKLPFRISSLCNKSKTESSNNNNNNTGTTAKRRRGNALKQKATARETVWLIFLLSLPELVVLTVGIAVYKPRLELVLDANNANLGQYQCADSSQQENNSAWVQKFSLSWMAIIFVAAIIVAWLGRDLPPFFNEKTVRSSLY
jgi:7 transmembrane sweet-taste receptor of 3 GCPR